MLYKSETVGTARGASSPKVLALSILGAVIAMGNTVTAGQAGDGEEDFFPNSEVSDNADVKALQGNLNSAGITLTPQTIQLMLDTYPEMLEAGEGEAGPAGAAAVYPAKFEVSGRDKIYEDTGLNTKNAGGRFSAVGIDIDVLLNYTSVLNGISYENMAVWGTSHSRDIEAKLAVDAEFEAFGVYGRADAGPPPYPATAYGVYGTTNQHSGYGGYFTNTSDSSDYSQALYAKGAGKNDVRSEDPRSYVATIEATNAHNASMLAIYSSSAEASSPDTFIGFIGRNRAGDADRLAGEIRGAFGASENGIQLTSYAADFAEFLPRANPDEKMEPGDIVGIVQGKISRDLRGAHHVQVISTSPVVSGNMPQPDQEHLYEQVAFIGQAPVKVKGVVKAGDYIVASGNNDGIGIAIAPDQMTPENFKMAVGQAWESSAETGVKLVNAAVGLAADDAYAYMKKQDQRIASLEQQLKARMARLDHLAGQLEALTQKVAYIQSASMAASAR